MNQDIETLMPSVNTKEVKKKIEPKQKEFILMICENLDRDYSDEIPEEKTGRPKDGDKLYKVQTRWFSTFIQLFVDSKHYFPEAFIQKVIAFRDSFIESHKNGGMTSLEELNQGKEILAEGREYIQKLEEFKEVKKIDKNKKQAA